MDTGKPAKTLADYLVIAVSPALIMVLVHSVCFFLVEVFYRGEAAGGVRWVLFWFVLAVVLIARIGIEQGDTHAVIYGIFLALVTWVYLSTVQPNVVFGAILLGMVWFTAHKITCNCTLIDDEADASGQGLLQTLKRLPPLFKKRETPAAKTVKTARPSSASVDEKKKNAAQIPGIWLIYYSLAALPIFGLGQTLLPAGDVSARRQGFIYLFCYLAAALGLMITTSFLGLRRYLRQRYLVMPGNIAFGWVQFGVVAAAMVSSLALLLPRPGAGEAWGALRYHVDYQLRRASEYAARFNPHGRGSGRAGNQTPANNPQANMPAQPGQASSPNQDQNTSANDHGNQPTSGDSKQGTPAGSEGGGHSEKPLPNLSPAAGSIYTWLKALFWFAVVLGLVWSLYRYRAVVLAMLRSIWMAIRNFIAALFGLFPSSATVTPAVSRKTAVPPFKTFKNPFLTGADRLWPPEKLIIYSYDALQSWVLENEAARGSPQTPREFCRQLGAEMPEAANALEHLAFLYGHAAYGASVPGNYDPEYLRQLWDVMANPRPIQPKDETQTVNG